MTGFPDRSSFQQHLGEPFRLRLDSGEAVPLELAEVTVIAAGRRAFGDGDAFSLLFRGARDFGVPQRIWRLEHDGLGELDIFLVPLGPDDEGSRFEAIFS